MPKTKSTSTSPLNPTGGFIGLFITMLVCFLLLPIFLDHSYAFLGFQLCFILIILSVTYIASYSHHNIYIGTALIVPFLILNFISLVNQSFSLNIFSYFFYCLYLIFAIAVLSERVFKSDNIDTNIIFGSITVYLLLGILWGKVYFLVDSLLPGSFEGIAKIENLPISFKDSAKNQFDLLYYSFTILTTLGIGDITPKHHLVKSLTALESMFGQLFVAIAISKMVSFWRRK